MRKLISLLCLLPLFVFGQPPADRYNAELFSAVTETQNVLFSDNVPQPNPGGGFYEFITGFPLNVDEYDTSPVDLRMDIFEPTGDTLSKRPVIIVAFGGGFLSGSRDYWSMRLLCQALAKRGYVTASIDYRLGMNVFDSDLANRAVYRGLQDARSAVRFFRADAAGANTYKIDPDRIFIGGHSSGAFAALHNAYLEKETERPIATYAWTQDGNAVADQGCLDCVGDNQSFSGHANAVFSLAGALGFTSFIETANDPTMVLFHSEDDGTVPYDSGSPFSGIIWLVVGSDLPDVYGSLPISLQADVLGLPYEFHSYTNREHGVHEDGSSALYTDIVPGISDWFFEEELKEEQVDISGDSVVCNFALQQSYTLPSVENYYFDWQVVGGTFTQMSNYSATVQVDWDANASDHILSVIPYNEIDAMGDNTTLDIQIMNGAVNTLVGINTQWGNIDNWSLGHLPGVCEDVMLPSDPMPRDLSLAGLATVNSLDVDSNWTLTIAPNAQLDINQKSVSFPNFALQVNGVLLNQGLLNIYNINSGKELKVTTPAQLDNFNVMNVGDQ